MKRVAIVAAVLLAGCTRVGVQAPLSAEAPTFRHYDTTPTGYGYQKFRLAKVLEASYDGCVPTTGDDAAVAACDDAKIDNFMGAGLALSDLYCDDFFRNANDSSRRRNYGRGLFNDAGAAVSGILNLVKAGSNALTASNVGFSAIDSTFRNYDTSFMVDPDLSKLRQLVLAAQDEMKKAIDAAPPKTIYAAESKVRRYASLCSFLGMKGLLNEAISRTATQIVQGEAKPAAAAGGAGGAGAGAAPAAGGAAGAAPAVMVAPPVPLPLLSTQVPPG